MTTMLTPPTDILTFLSDLCGFFWMDNSPRYLEVQTWFSQSAKMLFNSLKPFSHWLLSTLKTAEI